MMKLTFRGIRIDGSLATPWDALLRVVASFEIVVDERLWYAEEEFPLAEFANSLSRWLLDLEEGQHRDFCYASLEADEPWLMRFIRVGSGAWKIRALHEEYREERTFRTEDLRQSSADFLHCLRDQMPQASQVLALLEEREDNEPLVRLLRRVMVV